MFLCYHAARGHALLDRRLFPPAEWAADPARRAAAGVPGAVVFRIKPELALAMVVAGLPLRWVAGDGVYGDGRPSAGATGRSGKWYVPDSSADARVWTAEPELVPAGRKPSRGRPATAAGAETKPARAGEVAAGLPAWRRVAVAGRSQGPLAYGYAELAAWFSEEGAPAELAAVRSKRWSIGQDSQDAKGECGLNEYETRGRRGWHHRTALSVLALWSLARQRDRSGEKCPGLTVPEVRAVLVHLLDRWPWGEAGILAWSAWRRERNRRAKASHAKRRAKQAKRRRAREPAL